MKVDTTIGSKDDTTNISYNSLDFMYDENANDPYILAMAGHLKDPEGPKDNNKLKILSLSHYPPQRGGQKIDDKPHEKHQHIFSEKYDALGRYTQVKYVSYNNKCKGLLTSTHNGSVVVYSNSNTHDRIEQLVAHFGPVSHILVSPSNR